MTAADQPEQRIDINMDQETAKGVYANFVGVWHDRDQFVFDFSALVHPPRPGQDAETGQQFTHLTAQVVARVRVPPSQVFEIMKALNQQLSMWEAENGSKPSGPTES